MKSWKEEFESTWLADPDHGKRLDGWVRRNLASHRPAAATSLQAIAPWSVDQLVADILWLGTMQRWLWCSSAIAVMAELLFACELGGIFAEDDRRFRWDLQSNRKALRELRNAAFHPAFHDGNAGSGAPPIERFATLLDCDDELEVKETALKLIEDWSYFASRPVTSYALRQLNSAGILLVEELKIP